MKTKQTSQKQIYITVVTSGLLMLTNKVARVLKPNEDIFDACSELANEIAEENGLDYSNVLVQYFNHYSDKIPAMALKVPSSPFHARRKKALAWWNNLNLEEKFYKVIPWLKSKEMNVTDRHPYSLTGSEIEEIWIKESNQTKSEVFHHKLPDNLEELYSKANQKQDSFTRERNTLKRIADATGLKSNQKQFKQFDESLFKAYINKFSDEDKFKCLILILNELSEEVQFNAFLATLRKMKLDSQTEFNIMTLVALKDI